MKNLFGNLKNYKLHVFVIFLFLMLQAWCDLALPRYTQDIIDVGIIRSVYRNCMRPGFILLDFITAGVTMRLGICFFRYRKGAWQ